MKLPFSIRLQLLIPTLTACLILLVLFEVDRYIRKPVELRLIGTWISNRERTVTNLEEQWGLSNERQANLGKLLGKLKVTYNARICTSDMNGFVETIPYTVLAKDTNSVVIRDDSSPNPIMASLGTSKFSTIHFEGNDAYWIMSEIGGFREYFSRVPTPSVTR